MTQIVIINVSQQIAPTASNLQRMGAIVTAGGTGQVAGTEILLTQMSNLTSYLTPSLGISAATYAGGIVTFTTTGALNSNYANGDQVSMVLSGFSPSSFNGTFFATVTGASTFTISGQTAVPSSFASAQVIPTQVYELTAMATTFFAQGQTTPVYVLELGGHAANPANGPAALATWITANPGIFYSYLVPREWDQFGSVGLLNLLAQYEADTGKTYFFITTTSATYTQYTAVMKDAWTLIEAPAVSTAYTSTPATALEFSCAAPFYNSLNYQPSVTSQVAPFGNQFVSGVTPYPLKGNSATLTTWAAAGVNVIGTGYQGGISDTLVTPGTTMDLNDFSYWYSVDWVQINLALNLANAIINGSNNPTNPLYYNQAGITDLQGVAQQTMTNGVSFGMVLGPVTVTAVPFATYVKQNISDFKAGIYRGLACTFTPNRGFEQIIFQLVVSQFPSGGAIQ